MSDLYTQLVNRQQEEVRRVKKQAVQAAIILLTNQPFGYDEDVAKEIADDLIDGMAIQLNAGQPTAEKDLDTLNCFGKDLSSLKDNAILYCIIDEHAESFNPETLKLRDERKPFALFASGEVNYWPGNTENFSLTNIVKVASYKDLESAINCFLGQVAVPHNKWSSWIANIVVMGFKGNTGVTLKDCPGEILDVPLVLDLVDSFKITTGTPADLSNIRRGPFAARVVFSHNSANQDYPTEFGFKQYPYTNQGSEDIPSVYSHPRSILIHPDDERYVRQENETN